MSPDNSPRIPKPKTQPTWSPDGSDVIVYRSEQDGGGLFAMPAQGGPERRISTFGVRPKWAPNGSQVMFTSEPFGDVFYTVRLDGAPPRRALEKLDDSGFDVLSWNWHPDSRHVTFLGETGPKEEDWAAVDSRS